MGLHLSCCDGLLCDNHQLLNTDSFVAAELPTNCEGAERGGDSHCTAQFQGIFVDVRLPFVELASKCLAVLGKVQSCLVVI